MTRIRSVLFAAAASAIGHVAKGQAIDTSQIAFAKALVVHVTAPPREGHGAGIVVGVSKDFIYVATARHVLDILKSPDSVRVAFFGDSAAAVGARVAPKSYTSDATLFDVALLIVRRRDVEQLARRVDVARLELDRLADMKRVRPGDRVFSIGCPHGVCWETPADETVFGVGDHLTFLTQFVSPGNSGGALLSQWGEIVGMVVQSQPPVGRAVSVDLLLDRVRLLDATISLRRPAVPRWPYSIEMRALVLGPGAHDADQFPGGFAGLDLRMADHLAWHVGALHLVPENLAITALVGGGSLPWTAGRFTVAPFADIGISRTDARRDLGGYFTGTGASGPYVPAWSVTTAFGFGGGAGITAAALIVPSVSLEMMAAHWSFQLPLESPSMPSWYLGGGVRVAVR